MKLLKLTKLNETNLKNAFKKGDKSVIQINMDGSVGTELIPGKIKNIFTHDLCGCSACAILARCKNGNPFLIMTHFPPDRNSVHAQEIRRILKQNEIFIDTNKPASLLFSTPKSRLSNDIEEKDLFEQINLTAKKFFNNNIESKALPYTNEGDCRVFVINIPKNKGDDITYSALGNHSGNFGVL